MLHAYLRGRNLENACNEGTWYQQEGTRRARLVPPSMELHGANPWLYHGPPWLYVGEFDFL